MALKHNILHRDGAAKIYESPATIGQFLSYTTRGDDIQNKIIGSGVPLVITNEDSKNTKFIDAQFLEDIQLKDAYVFWESAVWGDTLTCEVILPANTPWPSLNNKGNAGLVNDAIQYITSSQVPDDTWVGTHNLFPIDIAIVRFVNEFRMLGTNQIGTTLESSGAALISKDLKIRIIYKNDISINKDIKIILLAEIYRENTI